MHTHFNLGTSMPRRGGEVPYIRWPAAPVGHARSFEVAEYQYEIVRETGELSEKETPTPKSPESLQRRVKLRHGHYVDAIDGSPIYSRSQEDAKCLSVADRIDAKSTRTSTVVRSTSEVFAHCNACAHSRSA